MSGEQGLDVVINRVLELLPGHEPAVVVAVEGADPLGDERLALVGLAGEFGRDLGARAAGVLPHRRVVVAAGTAASVALPAGERVEADLGRRRGDGRRVVRHALILPPRYDPVKASTPKWLNDLRTVGADRSHLVCQHKERHMLALGALSGGASSAVPDDPDLAGLRVFPT